MTLDGQPLAGFQVTLLNPNGGGGLAGAFIKSDGGYEIGKVRPGRYRVIIDRYRGPPAPGAAPVPGPETLPVRYSDPKLTELIAELELDKTTAQDFVLRSKP